MRELHELNSLHPLPQATPALPLPAVALRLVRSVLPSLCKTCCPAEMQAAKSHHDSSGNFPCTFLRDFIDRICLWISLDNFVRWHCSLDNTINTTSEHLHCTQSVTLKGLDSGLSDSLRHSGLGHMPYRAYNVGNTGMTRDLC